MGTLVYINGQFFEKKEAKISVFDRGFLSGDAIFEVVRTANGAPFMIREHLKRLERSAAKILLPLPLTLSKLESLVRHCCAKAENEESTLRIMVTRGVGPMSLNHEETEGPNLIIIVVPFKPHPERYYREGIHLAIVDARKIPPYCLDPAVKSNGYLLNILAQNESRKRGGMEAILLNVRGEVAECTQSNIFAIIENELLTPPLSAGILDGITRNNVITIAPETGHPCREKTIYPEQLYQAKEVFITSTTRNVMPVTSCDNYTIGNGKPGPVTRELMEAFDKFMRSQTTKI